MSLEKEYEIYKKTLEEKETLIKERDEEIKQINKKFDAAHFYYRI